MKVHMLSETVAFRPYDFLIDVSSGPWDYGLPGSARCIDCLKEIIYVFLTIFLYLLKCPQSLIL